jgi:hypothetical protein
LVQGPEEKRGFFGRRAGFLMLTGSVSLGRLRGENGLPITFGSERRQVRRKPDKKAARRKDGR